MIHLIMRNYPLIHHKKKKRQKNQVAQYSKSTTLNIVLMLPDKTNHLTPAPNIGYNNLFLRLSNQEILTIIMY